MQKKKEETIFKKLVKKDYKNELEEMLEHKYFGENAKSLLLEILYKIETAYKDYEVVKKDAKTKDEYIQNYMRIIEKKCKTIKIVKPNSEESKLLDGKTFLVNKKRSEIICLPIARKLLYSVAKIDKKEKIVNGKYYLLSTTVSDLINIGDCINTVEPLREFNGWSWTTVTREIESIEHNLIYQIMIILVGKKFMNDWIKNGDSIIDYLEEFENKLAEQYGDKLAKNISKTIQELSILMELKVNPDIKTYIQDSKKQIKESLEKFDNKELYIEELTQKKNKLQKMILKIDTTINDKQLLQEEYVKRNDNLPLEEKIFSIRVLANLMIEEREKLYKEMEEYNSLLKPKNFINKKEELQKEYNILKLASFKGEDEKLNAKKQQLQTLFLKCLEIKIKNAETKQDIINLFYRFRYYCILPYSIERNIYNEESIGQSIEQTGKMLIRKAIDLKTIQAFAEDENLNYKIMNSIFKIRIISLEELSMKLCKEKDNFFVQFFDDKTSDQKMKIELETINKKDLNIKFNKKVRLFE